ncbi:cytochrome P450 [Marasmius fiardii PR-910]|nr:cytochrome P450 [Marasmius fiardii PR-910]
MFLQLLFIGLGTYIVFRFLTSKKQQPLPPGPPGLPILRNLLDIPTSSEWETYGKWADQYGPIVSASAFGATIVVVNQYKAAIKMLSDNQKGAIYSSRPFFPMADLMGWEKAMAFTPYGHRFRKYRQVFHEELGNSKALRSYWPQEIAHARHFVRLCVDTPDRLVHHCFQHAGAIVLRVAYGYTAKDYDDPFVDAGNTAMETFNKGCTPGAYLVNNLPILRHVPEWVPGAGFQKQARLWRPLFGTMVDNPFNFVKQELSAGTAEDSFTAKWLKKGLSEDDEDVLKYASGSMFGGGGETTAITVHMFFIAMTLYPEIQKKAKKELDAVTGGYRLPTFEDRENLPYLEALTKEVMRYHPAVPNGLPHCTTEDDVHEGHFIPKGSIIITNIWKMLRDSDVYRDPETFNPDRFLGDDPEQNPRDALFGFGRRLCPGRHLADASVFITLATCLAALDISPVIEDGKPVLPEIKGEGGAVNHLVPFKCKITPRFDRQTLEDLMKEH